MPASLAVSRAQYDGFFHYQQGARPLSPRFFVTARRLSIAVPHAVIYRYAASHAGLQPLDKQSGTP